MSEEPLSKHRTSYAPISFNEYVETQKNHGSCKEEFNAGFKRCVKAGAFFGVPLGFYITYQHHGVTFSGVKHLIPKTAYCTLMSVVTFAGIGVMVGTYNCLRVVRE